MTESDNDIEFLDEDADIVQKCVQVQTVQYVPLPELVPVEDEKLTPLLVERRPVERRRKRKKVAEDDSDYDPSQDLAPQSPPSPKVKKKKQQVVSRKIFKVKKILKDVTSLKDVSKSVTAEELLMKRKSLNIRILDYDDPLCLPVKAIKQENSDVKRLNNWNNVCLEHFKHCDNMLKPEKGETKSSTRTVVFRNVVNKQSGKTDTTIWSKTCVENVDGDRKSEIFQCVLPRYKEKKVPSSFTFSNRKSKPYYLSDEVLLCKEEYKDDQVLVVYKPKETLSAVYKLVMANENKGFKEDADEKEDDEVKSYLKEILCAKMCVPCFQMSWRGITANNDKPIRCPICKRSSFMTAHNLLTHFKTHSEEDIRKFKPIISSILSEIVEYHYKCRVCREQFNSIKSLRHHLTTHQGKEPFTCEVGCHVTR